MIISILYPTPPHLSTPTQAQNQRMNNSCRSLSNLFILFSRKISDTIYLKIHGDKFCPLAGVYKTILMVMTLKVLVFTVFIIGLLESFFVKDIFYLVICNSRNFFYTLIVLNFEFGTNISCCFLRPGLPPVKRKLFS